MSTRDAAEDRGSFVIPSLDGLRAVSFLLVFLGHVGIPYIPGGFGVTVFFYLSGYLITTLLRMEATKTGKIDLKLFYLRRVLRIWPPFYIVMVIAGVLTSLGVLEGRLHVASEVAQALHYSNYWIVKSGWTGVAPGTGVYWSLAVEEHFYLIFPALYLALLKAKLSPRGQQWAFFAICAAVLAWRCALVLWFHSATDRTYIATDTRLDSMLFGCGLAVYGNPILDDPKEKKGKPPGPSDVAFLAVGLAALLISFTVRDGIFRETLRYTLQGLGLYPLFITAIRFPAWGPFRLLNLRLPKYLGKLSFSLYLVHQIVVMAIQQTGWVPAFIGVPLMLAVSIGIASLMWTYVEEPCAVVRRRLATRSLA